MVEENTPGADANTEVPDPNVTKVNLKGMAPSQEPEVYKVDLSNTNKDEAETETKQEELPGDVRSEGPTSAEGALQPESQAPLAGDVGVLTEITGEEEVPPLPATPEQTTQPVMPENIQKLVDFMEETGGDINDYVKLNRNVESLDASEVIDEYFKDTKPHLDAEERSFLLEETFGFDEDMDDEREIRGKKIALKEQEAEARQHLEKNKTKYYEEIKAGSKLTPDQQKAVDFFNRHNKDSKEREIRTKASTDAFKQGTDNVFNDNFKGFDYQVGDKKFRFNVKNAEETKVAQSDLNNFVNKFVGDDNTIQDTAGYHKSLFTAMNSDAIASHFYDQGKADAVKESIAKGKNINLDARQTHGEANVGGVKYKVLDDSTQGFKFKKKK